MKIGRWFLWVCLIFLSACSAPTPSAQPPTPAAATATALPTSPTSPTLTPSAEPTLTLTSTQTDTPAPSPTPTPAGIAPESVASLAQLHAFRPFNLNDLSSLLLNANPTGKGSAVLPSSLLPPSYLAMAYSPDGKFLALGGCTQLTGGDAHPYGCPPPGKPILRLMNAQTGEIVREFEGHTAGVTGLAFSPDGATLVSASEVLDGSIRFWETSTGKLLRSVKISSPTGIPALAVSPDGSKLVVAWYKNFRVWDFNTGEVVFDGASANGTPRFTQDGSRLAVFGSSERDSIVIYDTATWKPVFQFPIPAKTLTFALSADGKVAATGGENDKNPVHFWDASSGAELGHGEDDLAPYSMAFTPDGRTLFVAGFFKGAKYSIPLHLISAWDPATQKKLADIKGPSISPFLMALAPVGAELAYSDSGGDVFIWGPPDDSIRLARETLVTYLDDLNQGKYADAAGLYYSSKVDPNAPEYAFLKKSHPQLDLNDIPGVLQALCADKRFPCAKLRDTVFQGYMVENGITIYAELAAPDGSALVSPVPCNQIPSTCEPTTAFMFNLVKGADGGYKLTSLPPAAEFP